MKKATSLDYILVVLLLIFTLNGCGGGGGSSGSKGSTNVASLNYSPEIIDMDLNLNESFLEVVTYFKANDGSAIDYIFLKITSPIGKVYGYNYKTENNYLNGSSNTIISYVVHDVFDIDGTYTIEVYVQNEDGTLSSTYSKTTYITLPVAPVPSNVKPEVTAITFDQNDSSEIKIITHFNANDGSAIDYVYWTITSPNGKTYSYEYDMLTNYLDGWASITRTYELYDVFDVDGTYTIESYVKNEDGTLGSLYSEATYITLLVAPVPSNEKPEVTAITFDQSDSSEIKIITHFNANDGSAIDYVYWTITSPNGKTYSYEYDMLTNYLDGWASITRTYELYDVFDVDGTYTIESYVKNEDGTLGSLYSEATYITLPSSTITQQPFPSPSLNK